MNYLSVESLTKSFGIKVLFEDLSFGLDRADKVALIANNGSGKTTLLKILAGEEVQDEGNYTFRSGIRVSFLAQDPQFDESLTIEEFIQSANAEILELIERYESLSGKASSNNDRVLKELEEAQTKMDVRQAWDYHRRLDETLTRFGISQRDQSIKTLSGGQKKRLALAVCLVDQPDFLILDEPTNHLDIEMVEWLEDFLKSTSATILMVTHDRYFLDRVCNVILEMNHGNLYRHQGNYSYFLEKRAEREEAMQTEIDKASHLMKKELEWMRRQPKARTTKSKARVDRFSDIEAKAKSGIKDPKLQLDVKMSRIGGKVLELKKVRKSYGDLCMLDGFDYTFKKGERIGIIGKNGIGKSTFLNLITGSEQADSGKINVGETVVYGYYHQAGLDVKPDQRVIDVVKEVADVIQLSDGKKLTASGFLQLFMFTPEMQHNQVKKLSGGEKRRLHLLRVLMKNPNFLILDEPTNDLDLITLQKLEEFLENYPGCLLVVSHDRYFLDRMTEHLFIFEGGGKIKDFWGGYSDYKASLKEAESKPKQAEEPIKKEVPEQKSTEIKFSYKHKFEKEQLEKEIPKLEKEKSALEVEMQGVGEDYEKLSSVSLKLGEVNDALDEKLLRWMELDEMKE